MNWFKAKVIEDIPSGFGSDFIKYQTHVVVANYEGKVVLVTEDNRISTLSVSEAREHLVLTSKIPIDQDYFNQYQMLFNRRMY